MEKQPYRILQVVTIMNRGGIETMIMNHYRAIDRSKYQFDFLVHRQERGDYDDEIEQLGGKIYRAFPIRPWKYPMYFKWLNKFFMSHCNYIAVHSHIHENSGFVFKYAYKYSITRLLCTSHIAVNHIDYKFIFRIFPKLYLYKYCTDFLACGVEAGKYLYGKKEFKVIKNAINTEIFSYNINIRKRKRKELDVENKFVIGSVARFSPQKNHIFILKVFKDVLNKNKDVKLILVGDGPLENSIKEESIKLNLSSNIIFLGVRNDISELLQAFDVFIFPSLYEGLPVSIIEAQAASLPCILSNTIDPETAITNYVEFHSLDSPISEWSDAILSKQNFQRSDTSQEIINAGYDVNQNTEILINIYHPQNV